MKQQYTTPQVRELGSVTELTYGVKSGFVQDFESNTLSPPNTVLGSWK